MKHPDTAKLDIQIRRILAQVKKLTWWERLWLEIKRFAKWKLKWKEAAE